MTVQPDYLDPRTRAELIGDRHPETEPPPGRALADRERDAGEAPSLHEEFLSAEETSFEAIDANQDRIIQYSELLGYVAVIFRVTPLGKAINNVKNNSSDLLT